ncbi:MAG: chlorophyll synthesis pathway protein BchC [Deltaproteobacteria bacterium]
METVAIVLEAPEQLALRRLPLSAAGPSDVVVEVEYSAVSTGTERLLWSGRMPPFPGMGYPLVPGYETVGRVTAAGEEAGLTVGDRVFVPGASCFGDVRGLFGGAASRLVVPAQRARRIDAALEERSVLMALAATAHHAVRASAELPELIVGHGVLGRLIARIVVAEGGAPTVWEIDERRAMGAEGYAVTHPDGDERRDYGTILDASGDAGLIDGLILRLGRGGQITLAGFPDERVSFAFPPAFMKEARLVVAAEWAATDLDAVLAMVDDGRLSLDALITHRCAYEEAPQAYRTAFTEPSCLKMLLDWRSCR